MNIVCFCLILLGSAPPIGAPADASDRPKWTEIASTIIGALSFAGGLTAVLIWRQGQRDRSATVLIEIERDFAKEDLRVARSLIEDDAHYAILAPAISAYLAKAQLNPAQERMLEQLAVYLRFYVLLKGIRVARQVPDKSLRLCYAYWLNHYFHSQRTELKDYVSKFFPGLAGWLETDQHIKREKRFFRLRWRMTQNGWEAYVF